MIWETELDQFLQEKYPEMCMVEEWPWNWRYVRPEDLFEIIRKTQDKIRTWCYNRCLTIIKNCQSTIRDEPDTNYWLAENERIYEFIEYLWKPKIIWTT